MLLFNNIFSTSLLISIHSPLDRLRVIQIHIGDKNSTRKYEGAEIFRRDSYIIFSNVDKEISPLAPRILLASSSSSWRVAMTARRFPTSLPYTAGQLFQIPRQRSRSSMSKSMSGNIKLAKYFVRPQIQIFLVSRQKIVNSLCFLHSQLILF